MGKAGPRPKPTNLRVLHGDRKDRINTNEPVPPSKRVAMPAHLSPGAKSVWKRLAPELARKGLLTAWDRDVFAVFCEAVVHHREACELARRGVLVKGQKGEAVKNPALQIVRDSAQTIRAFAQEFGLSPSARSGITMPEGEEYEDLAAILS